MESNADFLRTITRTALVAAIAAPAALFAIGCGDSGGTGAGSSEGGGPNETVLTPDQPPLQGESECRITITTELPVEGQTHVTVCTPVQYQTNPPSSGDHWPIWAEFRTHDAAVPREMLVHNLEHGAVVMRHNCEGDCSEVIAAFEQAAEDFGVDEVCLSSPNGADRSRIIITPDPQLTAPIGISAWRATYVATCIDPPSIASFIEDHYAAGPENICAEGKDPTDPATGIPACGAE